MFFVVVKKSFLFQAEEKLRRSTFFENKQKIEEHNRRYKLNEMVMKQKLQQDEKPDMLSCIIEGFTLSYSGGQRY